VPNASFTTYVPSDLGSRIFAPRNCILAGITQELFTGDYTMRLNKPGAILLAATLASAAFVPSWIASAPAQDTQQSQQSIRVQVSLVNLFATVRDKKTKRIVPDLEQSNFKVTEDNTEQKISFFSRDSTLPITLALLIDTSGSEQYTLGAEQEAASRFFATVLRKNDLAMVMSFDSNADLLADFTDDRGTLDRAIQRARINAPVGLGPISGDPPGTIFYDAVYLACHEKLADEAGRKALIVVTDAYDEGSKLHVQDAIEAAQRTDTVIHILLIGDPRNFRVDEGTAKKLTDETGGRTIVVNSEKKLEDAFTQISEELRSQYTIGYYSTNPARDGSYRKIKVEATQKDLDVLTRRGYYAPKN
jgi:VWFA-related protein